MGEARSHRVFFALWPDDEATAHLSALAHELTTRGGGRVIWCLLPLLTVHSTFVSWHSYRIAVALHGLQRAHRALADSAIESVGLTAAPGSAAAVLPRFRHYVTEESLRPPVTPALMRWSPVVR